MWHAFGDRLRRAVLLDGAVYREVAADVHATGPAVAVVIGSALAEGLGRLPGEGLAGLLASVAEGCLAWSFWLLGVAVSMRLLENTPFPPLFRALGFAAAPFALGALEPLPWIGSLVLLAKWALGLAAAVTALREGLGVETPGALLGCGCGLLAAVLLSLPLAWLVGP